MKIRLSWDEAKRLANLRKHGLDFADAGEVLDSRYRLDAWVSRNGEERVFSLSYAAISGGADRGAYRARRHGARDQFSPCKP
jgi:uncharacterized DUF497 family protein